MVTPTENAAAAGLSLAERSKDEARRKPGNMKTIAFVLRSGGEFEPRHVPETVRALAGTRNTRRLPTPQSANWVSSQLGPASA